MASVHKRTGASGASFQVKYRTPEGAARSRTFKLKRDADKFARTVELSKDAGEFVDPRLGGVTVGDWARQWLNGKANLAPSTRSRYLGILEVHIAPRWDAVPLTAVRHDEVQAWLVALGADISPASVRKIYGVLSQSLDYAVRSGRLARNAATGVSLPRVQRAETRYLTHGQVDALAEAVGSEWALLVRFLAYTGLRFGEAAALRVANLDLLRRRVIVAESVTAVDGAMVFGPTKTHSRREVPAPVFLLAELEALVVRRGDPRALVFPGYRGAPLRASALRRAMVLPSEELGLCDPVLDADGRPVLDRGRPTFTGHFHPHEFRHTAASLAIASGADVKVVQLMLGHASATMTLDRYGHLFPDRLDAVAEAMEAARVSAVG